MQSYGLLYCNKAVRNIGHPINNYNFSIARYAGEYVPDGRQFIVVAGNINYETVQVTLSYESHLKNLSKYIVKTNHN